MDANAYAVEVEVGKLSVAMFAEEYAAVNAECEHIHHLCIVGMVNGKRECRLGNDRVNHSA